VLCSAAFWSAILLNNVRALNLEVETMFGLVMVLALVAVTVVPPVAVMATAKAKSRRK